MTTTREAALEAAAKSALGYLTGNMDGDLREEDDPVELLRAALSTPATEPQGYVEGLEAAASVCIERRQGWLAPYIRALAARPAPQPAADTRVVTVKPLDWQDMRSTGGTLAFFAMTIVGRYKVQHTGGAEHVFWVAPDGTLTRTPTLELAQSSAQEHYTAAILSAIIGNAAPTPSDKIAEAARVLLRSLGDYDRDRTHWAFEAAHIGQRNSNKPAPFNRIGDGLIAALRALAGKGE